MYTIEMHFYAKDVLFVRSLRGTVVMSLIMYSRARSFDPVLLQSMGLVFKPRSLLFKTLAVGGTLNRKSTNQTTCNLITVDQGRGTVCFKAVIL